MKPGALIKKNNNKTFTYASVATQIHLVQQVPTLLLLLTEYVLGFVRWQRWIWPGLWPITWRWQVYVHTWYIFIQHFSHKHKKAGDSKHLSGLYQLLGYRAEHILPGSVLWTLRTGSVHKKHPPDHKSKLIFSHNIVHSHQQVSMLFPVT